MKTYGNSLNWKEYSSEIVEKLKMYPFLNWKNLKTQRLI